MGQSSSSSHGAEPTLQNPFPVTPHLSSDLDRLSFVAARILNTPDIYNIENLSKMDVCGAYTVFLKQQIKDDLMHSYGKTLKPLSVKLPGEEKIQEIVYQDGSAIDKDKREKICTELAETMVQVISIVIASLASIQVSSPSREVVMRQASPPPSDAAKADAAKAGEHKGGGSIEDDKTRIVIDWFKKNGYFDVGKDTGSENIRLARQLLDPSAPKTFTKPTLYISFTQNDTTRGGELNIHAQILNIIASNQTLSDGFHMMCSLPFNIAENQYAIALQVLDSATTIQTAGILTKTGFTTFNNKLWHITDLLNVLFRTKNVGNVVETTQEMYQYKEKFKIFTQSNPSPAVLAHKKSIIETLFPPTPPAYPGFPGYAGFPGNPFGFQQPPQQKRYESVDLSQYSFTRPQAHTTTVSISAPGQRVINQLRHFNDLIPKQSSPAAVRAITLAGLLDASRAVHTNVCNDPYWTSTPNLSAIYPWATLQFLCLKGVTAKKEKNPSRAFEAEPSKKQLMDASRYEFEPEWTEVFISGLRKQYDTTPKLKISEKASGIILPPTAGAPSVIKPSAIGVATLDRMKFDDVSDLKIDGVTCKTSSTPRVQFREIQIAIHELHHLYDEHVHHIWELLNSLILIIQDPETKKELVRLHPLAVSHGEASVDYVKKKGAEARKLIAEFYVKVEEIYLEAAKSLKLA